VIEQRDDRKALRVVLLGAESTGKSTLAAALGRETGWPLVAEAARTWASRVNRPLTAFDVSTIAAIHLQERQSVLLAANHRGVAGILLDTDLLATRVYARHYHQIDPAWLRDAAAACRGDLYLLCADDFPFRSEEGQRGAETDRSVIQEAMQRAVAVSQAWVVWISGSPEERLAAAMEAISEYAETKTAGAAESGSGGSEES
jgi:HTH-type transcriptional repressor of NAD biosynthesis genes